MCGFLLCGDHQTCKQLSDEPIKQA